MGPVCAALARSFAPRDTMKLQTLMIGLLAFGLACTGFAKANDFGCSNANVQCQTIAGPGSIEIKGVVGAGAGFSQGKFCFKRTDSDLSEHWANGQAVVFIGAWVGVTPSLAGGNIGSGISIGTYTVELKDNNATCTPGGTTQTGSCLWEDDVVSETL